MRLLHILYFFASTLLLVGLAGCQQRAASKLQGRWEGRPDSAAQRIARDAEKYGDQPNAGRGEKSSTAGDTEQVTDWENYEVTLVMDFVSSESLEISLNGEQTVAGTWKILATTPSGCTIEVETESGDAAGEKQQVRRRFELLLDEREGTCVGFQLTEAGADAQLGALYFQRPGVGDGPAGNDSAGIDAEAI